MTSYSIDPFSLPWPNSSWHLSYSSFSSPLMSLTPSCSSAWFIGHHPLMYYSKRTGDLDWGWYLWITSFLWPRHAASEPAGLHRVRYLVSNFSGLISVSGSISSLVLCDQGFTACLKTSATFLWYLLQSLCTFFYLRYSAGPGQNQLSSRIHRITASGESLQKDNSLAGVEGEKYFGAKSFPEAVVRMQEACIKWYSFQPW